MPNKYINFIAKTILCIHILFFLKHISYNKASNTNKKQYLKIVTLLS